MFLGHYRRLGIDLVLSEFSILARCRRDTDCTRDTLDCDFDGVMGMDYDFYDLA